MQVISRDGLKTRIGTLLGQSDWVMLDAPRIADFAQVTEDPQPIHLDPEAGRRAGFDGAIAHGFLTLSMLSAMAYHALPVVEGQRASVNYGFDRIRFIRAVPSGGRIRAAFSLQEVVARGASAEMLVLGVAVEIEGENKPAVDAVWRVLYQF
ncbi:MAG: MaoC family dehydratase [Roseobacter sp.]